MISFQSTGVPSIAAIHNGTCRSASLSDLPHVVAPATGKTLERQLQGVRTGPAHTGSNDLKRHESSVAERRRVIACVGAGSLKDPVLGRAFLRRLGLLDPPGSVLDDPEVVEHARNTQRILAAKASRRIAPDSEELDSIVAAVTVNR